MARYTNGAPVVRGPFGGDCPTPLEAWMLRSLAWRRWQERTAWERLWDRLRGEVAPPEPGPHPSARRDDSQPPLHSTRGVS